MIEIGRRVGVLYEGRLEDGTVFDCSDWHKGNPLEFTIGNGMVIPGLEKAVADMSAYEKRTVTIPAREAYGERDERFRATGRVLYARDEGGALRAAVEPSEAYQHVTAWTRAFELTEHGLLVTDHIELDAPETLGGFRYYSGLRLT